MTRGLPSTCVLRTQLSCALLGWRVLGQSSGRADVQVTQPYTKLKQRTLQSPQCSRLACCSKDSVITCLLDWWMRIHWASSHPGVPVSPLSSADLSWRAGGLKVPGCPL